MNIRTVCFICKIAFCLIGFNVATRPAAEPRKSPSEGNSISIKADGGLSWIRSETELVRNYPIALEALRSVLEDYEAYPRFMPRLVRTTVLKRDVASTTIRQHYEISILGYRYPTEYDLTLQVDTSQAPNRWSLSWRLVDSDGSVGESSGSWTLEAESSGAPETQVVHRNSGSVRRRFPLQLTIMRAVAARELGRSMDAVFKEARRRTTALAETDRTSIIDSTE